MTEQQPPVKLTKKSLNEFIGWTNTRYNDYLGFGTKKENVNLVYNSIKNGHYTWISARKNKFGEHSITEHKDKTVFNIESASSVGENYYAKSNRYWKTKQVGGEYLIDCVNRSVTALGSGQILQFVK